MNKSDLQTYWCYSIEADGIEKVTGGVTGSLSAMLESAFRDGIYYSLSYKEIVITNIRQKCAVCDNRGYILTRKERSYFGKRKICPSCRGKTDKFQKLEDIKLVLPECVNISEKN